MRTIDQMVQQEVLCCMSHIVSTLASGVDIAYQTGNKELGELTEQAFELASPVPDYEEAAIQAGWTKQSGGQWNKGRDPDDGEMIVADSAEEACALFGIEPYDREVFEHWAVTDWLADKLIEEGEQVDKDFGNLCIWARTTTGQGIASDGVIERIYAKMTQPVEP